MNEISTQDLLSIAAVGVLLMDAAASVVLKQRGHEKLAKLALFGGVVTAVALLAVAYLAF